MSKIRVFTDGRHEGEVVRAALEPNAADSRNDAASIVAWAQRVAPAWEHWDCTFALMAPGSTGALGVHKALQAMVDSGAPEVPPKQLFAALLAELDRIWASLSQRLRAQMDPEVPLAAIQTDAAEVRLRRLAAKGLMVDRGIVWGRTPLGAAVLRRAKEKRHA